MSAAPMPVTSSQSIAERVANSGFDPLQLKASSILARLPVTFQPEDCLVIDEEKSDVLYHTIASLLGRVPLYIVTAGAKDIKPAPSQHTLGFVAETSLRSLLALKVPKKFHLIIFVAKSITPAADAILKVIQEKLRQDGIAIAVSADEEKEAGMAGLRVIPTPELVKTLFPYEGRITILSKA
jgi:hypothetical protein